MKSLSAVSLPNLIMGLASLSVLSLNGFAGTGIAGQQSFDKGWRFVQRDVSGGEQVDLDDSTWRVLDVPHDWAFEADYSRDAAQRDTGGYKPGGIGWYRKQFEVPAEWQNKRVSIHFDGVYMNSEVWINGHRLGKRPYGYIPFHYDLTEYLQPGENVVAVRVDNSLEPSARWYHGCGIYAHVNLQATAPIHVANDGVLIRTPKVDKKHAAVSVTTELVNQTEQPAKMALRTQILDQESVVVAEVRKSVLIPAGEIQTVTQDLAIKNPELWSPESPTLYRVRSTLANGEEVVTRFGVRTIRWDTATGFWINGKNTKLLGVADHMEAGPVGAAIPDELNRWKIQLLKDMGCNAIRVAHNPQTPAFYDLCDELGMLVMDEIFDGWSRKAKQDYGKQAFNEWWERDLRTWLKANRNHPSVVIWSMGNETHGKVASKLVEVCHELDPTRLVTSGHSGSEVMDVLGVNGASESQRFYQKPPPEKPFVATEAPHTWQVRGYYRSQSWFRDGANARSGPFPLPDLTEKEIFTYDWIDPAKREHRKQIFNSSYDNAMVRITARKNWELMRDLPWYSGHFRWTGFDYLGEAGYVHGGWPFRAFMGGALDLAGFKKDLFYFYQSQWTTKPMAHILPHWTHPKMAAGTEVPVWVYSNCDEVELFLNGKSLGKDQPGTKWDEMQCEWMVPWTPGKLVAIGYQDGVEVIRDTQQTAAEPAQLRLAATGDLNPIVTVEQVDEKGVMNPYAENRIHYHVDGPARILSLESGNPVNTENNYGQPSREAFFGKSRCFLGLTASSKAESASDLAVVAGAILGDKNLMTSHSISIDVQSIAIQGETSGDDFQVRYSVDGSDPSLQYEGSFKVKDDTLVRATVSRGDELLFEMQERFGPGQGLYWGSPQDESEEVAKSNGDQAEDAVFQNARVVTKGTGFHGKGFLDFGSKANAFVEWYQENDGDDYEGSISIRYSCKASKGGGRTMKLLHNGKVIKANLFFPNTATWGRDWKTVQVKVPFVRGGNTLRLATLTGGGPYIDELIVQ
ncbi:beta-galactosidase [Neorhodopirellula lusitana]|uniref:Beta-galactosidase n=1 Tax=Neorhodopirellula lusitana TaxID=445327 RepID=A0ABY1QMF3_9BACT|nr:glycoside hydrolase family 2 TIM barrel-domain containing protein [Neorhodopirellula lusitana]SMP73244.1 beta-galactosidase [Neorhodopirellula lusitana]